jgi:hypothetical protein
MCRPPSSHVWTALDESARADLFVAAAKSELLDSRLQSCGAYMTPAYFRHGDAVIRGAAASADIETGFMCVVNQDHLISVATVRAMLGSELIRLQTLPGSRGDGITAHSGETLRRRVSEDRALMAVLLLRERSRSRSRLAPYIHAFLQLPDGVPAGWDGQTPEGAERRSLLKATSPALLEKADMLRAVIAQKHAQLVPKALEQLPGVLSEGLPCSVGAAGCGKEELARYYSVERFAQVWLAISSRDFVNSLQEKSETPLDGAHPFPTTFLVPLADLMNHDQSRPTVEVSYDVHRRGFVLQATRLVREGEELLFSYGSQLCRQTSLGRYGFVDSDMDACPSHG